MQTAPSLLRSDDPLANLYAQVVAEGIALNVDPEMLLRATAEAFDFLLQSRAAVAPGE